MVEEILNERQKTHGNFDEVAAVAQSIKEVVWEHAGQRLSTSQREAIDMIASKIARIVCGDPNEQDHWIDIAGYAELGRRACRKEQR